MSDNATTEQARKLKLVLCWHMHQPEYRDPQSGHYQQPWTYLHAIKDYVDMAAHLETHPGARAVVNFVPVLLEQLDDYAGRIRAWRAAGGDLGDVLLRALADPACLAPAEREWVVRACLRANEERLIRRFAPFNELAAVARRFLARPSDVVYLSDQFVSDILMWYHLAWMGETVRRSHAQVTGWERKGREFSREDRHAMLVLVGELIEGLFSRYRALADAGRVELSMTPYAHPIMPLLLDLSSMAEAMPDAPRPAHARYPGGEARVRWHLSEGQRVFRAYFGREARGCWPSEGSLSDATIRCLSEAGFDWCASGGGVLHNSLRAGSLAERYTPCPHRPYQLEGTRTACFFRDDGLSDLIGFEYKTWHADDAISNLIGHLEEIAQRCNGGEHVVSIVLDGENAWEYYPFNGFYLLDALYRRLSEHPSLCLTTFSEVLEGPLGLAPLPHVVAGSWVFGTFSTWIGEKDKNRGWDMLIEAKRVYDRVMAAGRLGEEASEAAARQLAICEGSDWFWWFGDYNPAEAVSDFERLFRLHLTRLYLLLGEKPPETLAHTFARGAGAPAQGGVMRPGQVAS
ncbi:MAG: glycoside hydrolase family 57 protein [Pseudomonadota bacterium]|mgnify:CR=1 FL=1